MDHWAEKLPGAIEAFFFIAGSDPTKVAMAHRVYADFHKQYPYATTKLVQLDLHSVDRPVVVVRDPAASR